MKKVLILLLTALLLVSSCSTIISNNKDNESGNAETLPQKGSLFTDKEVYLIDETVYLTLKISQTFPNMDIEIGSVELELYSGHSEEIVSYNKQNTIEFEGNFDVVATKYPNPGETTISSGDTREMKYELKALKEGKYTLAALINSDLGGSREITEICVVESLDKINEICSKNNENTLNRSNSNITGGSLPPI